MRRRSVTPSTGRSDRTRSHHERVARACRRPADAVAADMRAGRILTAEEAHSYGLVDAVAAGPSRLTDSYT